MGRRSMMAVLTQARWPKAPIAARFGGTIRLAGIASAAAGFACVGLFGCGREQPGPRGQTVVYLDTDVPVPEFGDTVLVEHLDSDGNVIAAVEHAAPNARDWPLSFGVLPDPKGPVRFRVRLFPETRILDRERSIPGMPVASSGGEVIGVGDPDAGFEKVALHEPLPGFTIDRLFELSAPDQGIARVRVDLSGACLGVPTQPKTGSETCLVNPHDGIAYVGTANEGVVALSDPLQSADSRVGSWEGAKEVDCRGSPRAGTGLHEEEVCIKGGAFFLGDERMESAGCSPACATIPERLVVLSPFFMDKYEVSVGRWRVAIEKGFSTKNPWLAEKNYKYCKYRPDGVNDDWPMNCVSWEAATDFCAYDGGRLLPSEAQWEYAASGRGREWMYVWGNDLVECWRSVFARVGASLGYPQPAQFGTFLECKDMGEGPAKVGALSGVGQDATRDGVVDMNGNLREWTRDETQSYNLGCWAKPMDKDPTCADGLKFQWSDSTIQPFHTVRGGCWGGGSGMMAVAWRAPILLGESGQKEHFTFWGGEAPFLGFRCVRETKAGGT